MKPFGVVGVALESVGEAYALTDAITFTLGHLDPANGYYHVLEQTAMAVRTHAETYQLTHGDDAEEPYAMSFPEQMGADMVRTIVSAVRSSHPDPLVRDTLNAVQRSYEDHVFNDAMGGDTPPPAPLEM